jgi:hypothetical protein
MLALYTIQGQVYNQQSALTVMSEETKAGCEIAYRHRPVWVTGAAWIIDAMAAGKCLH